MIELAMTRAMAVALQLRALSSADKFTAPPSIVVRDDRGGLWIWPINERLLQENKRR